MAEISMRHTFTTLVALMSLIPLVSLSAQTERQQVLVGARVRITVPDTMRIGEQPSSARPLMVIGQLVAVSDSTMSVRNEASSGYVTVPLSRVQRLEVSTGSRRGASAVTGGLIGLGVGGILGYAGGEDCDGEGWCFFPREETAVVGALLGAAMGSVVGLIVGRGERWRDTEVPARLSVIPTGTRSISVTSTLRF
jgi:hypothetical protein